MAIGTLLRHIIRGKQETCEACRSSFTCGPIASCWCREEKVPAETLRELRQKYHRCLCPECLRSASNSQADK